ncbi:MAG TPA: glycosyltransferase [Stellaceae bacterium]|jgi:glycosyltransferase involved in cell wall biosynthesis|nr:glycosyltransferase [Stellaceae bacterium]
MAGAPLVSPLVSVIIPALNAGATLGRALDSVAAQTYSHWEAIVIDDGSSDDTALLVEGRGDPRCRAVRRTTRGGPSRARNDGIAAAQGTAIALLDADDEWLPEKLARQVAALAHHQAASLVVCDMRAVHPDGSAGTSVFTRQAPSAGPEAWKALLASSFIGTSAVLAPRDLVRELGGFDESLAVGEDQDFFIRLALRGEVVVLPEALATYYYRDTSYSAAYAGDQARIVLGMVRHHLAVESGRLSRSERRHILAQRYGRLGRNLIAAGARGRGARLILEAAGLGSVTIENLSALLHAVRG